ncbi:MAG: rod shape-determining protein MreD [Planctomycetes bacterium]|nr:rod shape-determining protein MreD [Planctomycetota bacterium]
MTTLVALKPSQSPNPAIRWGIVFVGGCALALIHAFSLPTLQLDDATPDLFTLGALFLALYAHREGRYLPCLMLGLVRDCVSLGLLGSYAVLYGLLWKFASRLRARFDPDHPLNAAVFSLAGVFLVNLGYHVMLALSGDGIGWGRALMRCLTVACATAPLSVLLFPLGRAMLASWGVQRGQGGFFNI